MVRKITSILLTAVLALCVLVSSVAYAENGLQDGTQDVEVEKSKGSGSVGLLYEVTKVPDTVEKPKQPDKDTTGKAAPQTGQDAFIIVMGLAGVVVVSLGCILLSRRKEDKRDSIYNE